MFSIGAVPVCIPTRAVNEGSFSPQPLQYLLLPVLLTTPILTAVRWYLIMLYFKNVCSLNFQIMCSTYFSSTSRYHFRKSTSKFKSISLILKLKKYNKCIPSNQIVWKHRGHRIIPKRVEDIKDYSDKLSDHVWGREWKIEVGCVDCPGKAAWALETGSE